MRVVVNGWFGASLATGSGQYLAALLDWLPRVSRDRGCEFIVVVPAIHSAGMQAPPGWQVRLVRTPFDAFSENLAKLWFEQWAFPQLCRSLRADCGWTPYWGSSWWRPCPMVVTIHDLIPLLLPAYRGGALQRAYSSLVAAAARRADAILTDSDASRSDIIRRLGIDPARVHRVHLAVAPSISAGDAGVLERHGLQQRPFLFYVGGFDARKNLVRTIEAYARLVERLKREGVEPPLLAVAGRLPPADSAFAPDPRPVVERLRIIEHVFFLGRVDEQEKAVLYRAACGVLYVSEYEGFGLPVLEAMAARSARPPGA